MSRVEPTRRSSEQRETQQRGDEQNHSNASNAGHDTPSKAEGDEATIDEALRRQDRQ